MAFCQHRVSLPGMNETSEKSGEIGHRTVTEASVMGFGCLTGDYAQMHFDLEFGHGAGMGGPIAHGLLSATWSLGALTLYAPQRLAIGDPKAYLGGFRIRFSRMVHIGDRFSLRWAAGSAPCVDGLEAFAPLNTEFEILNQRGEVTCTGAVSVCHADAAGDSPGLPALPEPLVIEACSAEPLAAPLFAEDLVAQGPRGESLGRTVSEADVVGFANFSGELNPVYLNEVFAGSGRFGTRIASPMWAFCIGFGDYLRELLSISMPSSGFAGHLGDSWRFLAPIRIGDTIRTRHRPISCQASKSRPGMGIVEFGLQLLNQRDEIVQDGRVAMMIPMRRDD
ncbi:MAG: MaoC family dehydratase N-terminal domain-containing protein [Deltaproteobacteria bacterium]|nr:MaoC family dehydratase N-terminal domain-containing protein [Deltaproteobacteria bacterium]